MREQRFTTKISRSGRETYYDEKGREIGHMDPFRNRFDIRNKDGIKVGSVELDDYGRKTITILKRPGIGREGTTLVESSEPSADLFCDECDDYDCSRNH